MKVVPAKGRKGRYSWIVYIPPGLDGNERRQPRYFVHKREAEEFCVEMNKRKEAKMVGGVERYHKGLRTNGASVADWLEATGEAR
jgi:hypothetical protein